ncbi:MAG TPA: PqiC family protein [Stellaceae bacterium]|nr:PqiC family protein [Stellaceae bacterium]
MTFAARLAAPLLGLVVPLAGCGSSPPSKFYVLTADPVPQRAGGSAAGNTVALGRVTLPGALDRPQIARRHAGNEIVFSEEERWAGPLDDMMRHVLADDLAARLPAGVMLVESGAKQPPGVTIALDVSRFDADEAGSVTLVAHWQALGRNGAPLGAPRESTIVEPGSGKDAAAVAATMSRAVAALAARIAAGLR